MGYEVFTVVDGDTIGRWNEGTKYPSLRAAGLAVLRHLEITLDGIEAGEKPRWIALEEARDDLAWLLDTRKYTGPVYIDLPGDLTLEVRYTD